jgi:serine/threonine protein kinase
LFFTGSAPFGDTDELNKFEVLNNINGKTVMYPLLMSRSLKKLISGLLQRDPKRRSKWDQFHESDWCSEVNWDSVLQCKVKPPWTPPPSNTPSTSNFLAWSDIEVPVIPASKEVSLISFFVYMMNIYMCILVFLFRYFLITRIKYMCINIYVSIFMCVYICHLGYKVCS